MYLFILGSLEFKHELNWCPVWLFKFHHLQPLKSTSKKNSLTSYPLMTFLKRLSDFWSFLGFYLLDYQVQLMILYQNFKWAFNPLMVWAWFVWSFQTFDQPFYLILSFQILGNKFRVLMVNSSHDVTKDFYPWD